MVSVNVFLDCISGGFSFPCEFGEKKYLSDSGSMTLVFMTADNSKLSPQL